jgi:hypothetical protein
MRAGMVTGSIINLIGPEHSAGYGDEKHHLIHLIGPEHSAGYGDEKHHLIHLIGPEHSAGYYRKDHSIHLVTMVLLRTFCGLLQEGSFDPSCHHGSSAGYW